MTTKATMTDTETVTEEQGHEVEPLIPGSWCGERYAKLLGREIAEEVLNSDRDGGVWEDDETRAWWTEFYGDLRTLELRDSDDVAEFLRKYYDERVGDLSEDGLSTCAEVFAEIIRRGEF